MKLSLVYVTAKDDDEARRIGRELVEARLAAGVNIVPAVSSIYRWQGEVRDNTEAVLIAKTREALVPRLIDKVKSLHSYDCPCIVALPILDGNPAFLDWIADETQNGDR